MAEGKKPILIPPQGDDNYLILVPVPKEKVQDGLKVKMEIVWDTDSEERDCVCDDFCFTDIL